MAFVFLLTACASTVPPPAPSSLERIEHLGRPDQLTIGSVVQVEGTFDLGTVSEEGTALQVVAEGVQFEFEVFTSLPLTFLVTREFVEDVGDGPVAVVARLVGDVVTEPHDDTWVVMHDLPLRLGEAPSGAFHYNDRLVLRGDGFHGPTEGALRFCAAGTFTAESAAGRPVSHCVEAAPLEEGARDRATAVLSSAFGDVGGAPGVFDGEIWLESRRDRDVRQTERHAVEWSIGPPEVFGFEPTMASLETRVGIAGAGFMDPADGTSIATTVLHLEGYFTDTSGTRRPIDEALVPLYVSGTHVEWALRSQPEDSRLVSTFFGAAEGFFEGTMVPELLADETRVVGESTPVELILGPIRQVVWLRFLPQFAESLPRFGLSATYASIRERIRERVQNLYADYRVEVRLEAPLDVTVSGTTIVEIGGPDPAGQGLFGRDSSPGKDVGNLRLFDRIGGANAEVQDDGFAGFGGVFVESYLWWSAHPDLPVPRPLMAPAPDPLFDEVFDPIRGVPVTFVESRGEGTPHRMREVERATAAFANLVGETVAHELGHALGLADPFGAADIFHNARDQPGCLMDAGPDRPLQERIGRMGEGSFESTKFCGDALTYLRAILGS